MKPYSQIPKNFLPGGLLSTFITFTGALVVEGVEFTHQVVDPEISSQARQIGDFDGDGKGDILVIEGEFEPVRFAWYQFPEWTRHDINAEALESFHYVADCAVGDVDFDGDDDIIFPDAHDEGMRVLWFENPLPDGNPEIDEWTMHLIADLGAVSYLKDIEIADFDRNGKLDTAVRGEREIHISYQNQPDSWKTVSFPTKGHEGMAVGDIDRDGLTDIVSNGFWLKNPGKRQETAWQEFTFDPKWYNQEGGDWQDNNVQVRTADINADGLLDILIANSEKAGYPVSWYRAPKDPLNGTWREMPIGQLDYCHTLQPGDYDMDGDIDVLAAEMKKDGSDGRMVLYLQDGAPRSPESWKETDIQWTEQEIQALGAYWAVSGDLGGDGDIDIVSSRRYDLPPIEIWENRTNDKSMDLDAWTYIEVDSELGKWGDFGAPEWLRYFGVTAGDVTGDGYAEIIFGRYCHVNPGGDMTGSWKRCDLGFNVDAMFVVDVDGDEYADVIGESLPNIYWLEATDLSGASWQVTQVARIPRTGHHNSQGYAQAQIFPGGKPELLFESGEGVYCIEIPASPEAGEWPTLLLTEKGTHAEGIGTGDIDGDGYLDIATGMGWVGLVWWRNSGNHSGDWKRFEVGRIDRDYIDKIAIADINGDGRNDIVAVEELYPDKKPANAYWFEQPANPMGEPAYFAWKRHTITEGKYTLNNMNIHDMDHDGDIDIVVAEHQGSRNNFVYENDGNGNFVEHLIASDKEGHGGAFIFDLDGDGDMDVVNIAWETYQFLHLFRNDAAGQ